MRRDALSGGAVRSDSASRCRFGGRPPCFARSSVGWRFSAPCRWRTPQSGPAPITQYETPAEARWAPFSSQLPTCDDASVLSTVSGRFAQTENTYWGGQHAIDGFERVREIGFRANGLSYIPRRYCVARADDGRSARRRLRSSGGPPPSSTTSPPTPASSAGTGASSGASSDSTASTPMSRLATCCGRSSSVGSARQPGGRVRAQGALLTWRVSWATLPIASVRESGRSSPSPRF